MDEVNNLRKEETQGNDFDANDNEIDGIEIFKIDNDAIATETTNPPGKVMSDLF